MVKVTNQMVMSEGLSFHWHGLLQHGTQHMDGVAMLTQCPIPNFTTFTYRWVGGRDRGGGGERERERERGRERGGRERERGGRERE